MSCVCVHGMSLVVEVFLVKLEESSCNRMKILSFPWIGCGNTVQNRDLTLEMVIQEFLTCFTHMN